MLFPLEVNTVAWVEGRVVNVADPSGKVYELPWDDCRNGGLPQQAGPDLNDWVPPVRTPVYRGGFKYENLCTDERDRFGNWITRDFFFECNSIKRPNARLDAIRCDVVSEACQCANAIGTERYVYHPGVDIGTNHTPVYAVADGTIARIAFDSSGYGNYVILQHGPNLFTLYAHLSEVSDRLHRHLEIGNGVQRGEYIGRSGSTGAPEIDHLHFEIRRESQNFFYPRSRDNLNARFFSPSEINGIGNEFVGNLGPHLVVNYIGQNEGQYPACPEECCAS